MITIAPSLKIKYIKKSSKLNYWNKKENYFFFSKTAYSLVILLDSYIELKKKKELYIMVPDYFCNMTLEIIKNEKINIIYYPIDFNFEPKWEQCKEISNKYNIDMFIFVHYFGIIQNIVRAREFCKLNNYILIEDCTHMLYIQEKAGNSGDFIVFSPYKLLSIPDGAILIDNCSQPELSKSLRKKYERLSIQKSSIKWLIKRIIQNFIPYFPKNIYHENSLIVKKTINLDKEPKKISKLGYFLLSKYDYIDLKKISYERKRNLETLSFLMKKENSKINCLNTIKENGTPYLGIFSLKEVSKKDIIEQLKLKKYLLQTWPDLPAEVLRNPNYHKTAIELNKEIITLPLHQSITSNNLIQKYMLVNKNIAKKNENEINIKWCFNKEEWDERYNKLDKSNITQDWIYGETKEKLENWKVKRGIIYKNNKEIGIVQILQKYFLGIPIIIRINRGPLFFEKNIDLETLKNIFLFLKKQFFRKIIFILPELERKVFYLYELEKIGYRFKNKISYISSWINLKKTEDELRKQLKSKWRNQLKNAEKQDIEIKEFSGNFKEIIKRYEKNMKEKSFKGIPSIYLEYIYKKKSNSLIVLVAYSKNEMLGFDIAYCHGKSATYLVGWENEQGKRNNVNNILLFNLILKLKNKGCEYFDMGGIDEINTEGVAKFKRGLSGIEYEILGEFVSFNWRNRNEK